jgi:hypothetical protein
LLSALDPSINQKDASEKRQDDTGFWIVEGDSFYQWKHESNSFLWQNGAAGCGKTSLCSTITSHALDFTVTHDRCATVSYYFKFTDIVNQTVAGCLKLLLLQLVLQGVFVPKSQLPYFTNTKVASNLEGDITGL